MSLNVNIRRHKNYYGPSHDFNKKRLNEGDGNKTNENSREVPIRNSPLLEDQTSQLSFPYLLSVWSLYLSVLIFDVLSDLSTASLFLQQSRYGEYYATLTFVILPLTIVSAISIALYSHDEPSHKFSLPWIIRIFSHGLLLSVFLRRIEILFRKLRYECSGRGGKGKRSRRNENYYLSEVNENHRAVTLTLIQSFLHDLPQLILQSYLCIKEVTQNLEKEDNEIHCSRLCISQLTSIFSSIISLIFSIMCYFQSQRLCMRNGIGKIKLSIPDYFYQWIWLIGISGARIFAFSMALANINMKIALTYLAVITFHWLVYTIYFKNKNEGQPVALEVFSIEISTSVQILMENARDWGLGIAHTFCFLDYFNNLWKDRIELNTFNFLIFGEDSMFLLGWYFKYTYKPHSWIYHAALGYYYFSFLIGIAAKSLYFRKVNGLTATQYKKYSRPGKGTLKNEY